ncbi:MAG: serpin family protein [Solirubrobacteraceae bacterium]
MAATNRLALALLKALGDGGNVVLSPYSVQTALAMIDQGAAGQTALQIGQVLGESDPATLAASNRALIVSLARAVQAHGPGKAAPRLEDANSIWLQSGLALRSAFSGSLATNFGVAPQLADFKSAPDTARLRINSWVAQRTEQLIQELMPPGTINSQTSLVLADAIYLKAHWQSPFDSSTVRLPFFPVSGPPVQVPFLTQQSTLDTLPYGHGPGYRAIELPYLESTLAMLAIMPTPGTIARFELGLSVAELQRIAGSLSDSYIVNLAMPRLQLSVHTELNDVLAALGMPLAFEDGADFSGITAQVPLEIQAVEHAAVLKLDQNGTVATAATGISVEPTAAAPVGGRTSLTLDHPFLLFLLDRATGAVLFAGRVANPLP